MQLGRSANVVGVEVGGLETRVGDQIGVVRKAIEVLEQLLVFKQLMTFEIGHDHLSGAKTAAVDNAVGIDVNETRFRPGDYEPVIERKSTRTQAVAIEGRLRLVRRR